MHDTKNIIHQDVKLDNLFENKLTGEIKLGDLGFATFLDEIHGKEKIRNEGYEAPEIEGGQDNRGPWIDIWALSVTFIKLLTGDKDSHPLVAIEKIENKTKVKELLLLGLNENLEERTAKKMLEFIE